MTFKVGSKVFYPSHGAGKIVKEKEIEFDGQKKRYFEFELITNPLSISTPVDNVENLGIREIMKEADIKKIITDLKKNPTKNPRVKDFNAMLNMFKELESSSDLEASVKIIQYCNHVKKTREKEGRLIPISIEKQLKTAIANIVGEIAISTNTELDKAAKQFTKITGIETELEK